METSPLVSVLMTAFNREKFIAEAIESVLASSYTSFELIIVDDCSVDSTVELAKRYEELDKRVKVYVNDKNLGQFPNRNKALTYAAGEYTIYADSDDKILPEGIEDLVSLMESHPECSFGMYSPKSNSYSILKSEEAIRNHFFKEPFLFQGPGATILKTRFLKEIGGYPVDYGIPGDMFFNLKACCFSPIILIPFEFMYYRRHEGQEINNSYDYLYNNYKYMKDALWKLPLPITENQKIWLDRKNKRRFVVNICNFFFKTLDTTKTSKAIRNANFHFKDFIQGVFH